MVHAKVTVAAEHEHVVDLVSVGVGDAAFANILGGEREHIHCPSDGNHFREDTYFHLQNAENRDFADGYRAPDFPFASRQNSTRSPQIRRPENFAIGGTGQDGGTDRVDGFIWHIVGEPVFLSNLSDGESQIGKLNET